MDPQACFDEFIKNISSDSFDEHSAVEHGESLLHWLHKGVYASIVSTRQLESLVECVVDYMNCIS